MSKPNRKTRIPAIEAYLEEKGMSQQQFADELKVSQGLVWQWLNGQTSITPEKAKEIEEKTGIPRMKLLYPAERAA